MQINRYGLILLACVFTLVAAGALPMVSAPLFAGAVGTEGLVQMIRPDSNCAGTSVSMTPLIDMTTTYKGYAGKLYPGSNQPPATYQQVGLAKASQITPLNLNGLKDPNGKIVLLSIGMSNTRYEFEQFIAQEKTDTQLNPKLVIVDGAQGGWDAELAKTVDFHWTNIDGYLRNAGVNGKQVQVVWLKEAIAQEAEAFPTDANRLKNDLKAIIGIMQPRYPNLKLIYVSSRTYGGYASTTLSPEPYAYQGGFAVKWLIQERLNAPTTGPWVAWGPYLWTNGTKGRSDGLVWTCTDVQSDGTHPSTSGAQKVANLLINFFKSNPTTRSWYLRATTGQFLPMVLAEFPR